jgi:hypothetical protein
MKSLATGGADQHGFADKSRHAPADPKEPDWNATNCWQPHGKLLASGNAVSDWSGARQRSMMANLLAVQAT